MVEVDEEITYKGCQAIVKFKGETSFAPGLWIGLELSKPTGKNNGSVNGVRYFECMENHGIFVKEIGLSIDTEADAKIRVVIDKLQEKLYVISKENSELKLRLQEVYNENLSLQASLSELHHNNENGLIEKENYKERIEQLEHEILQLKSRNSTLNQNLITLDMNSKTIKNCNNIKDDPVISDTHTGLIERQQLELSQISGRLDDSNLLIKELEAEIDVLKDHINDHQKQLALHNETVNLNNELKAKISDLEDLLLVQKDIEIINLEMEKHLTSQINILKQKMDDKGTDVKLSGEVYDLTSIIHSDINANELINRVHMLTLEKQILSRKLEFFQFEISVVSRNWDKNHYVTCIKELLKVVDESSLSETSTTNEYLTIIRVRMSILSLIARIETFGSLDVSELTEFYSEFRNNILSGKFDLVFLMEVKDKLDSLKHSQLEKNTVILKEEFFSYNALISLLTHLEGTVGEDSSFLLDIRKAISSRNFEESMSSSIKFLEEQTSQDSTCFEYDGQLPRLTNDIINEIEKTKELSGFGGSADIGNELKVAISQVVSYFDSFKPLNIQIGIPYQNRDQEQNEEQTIVLTKEGPFPENDNKLQAALDTSRFLDAQELRSKVKSLRQEAYNLRGIIRNKDLKILNLKSESERLQQDIQSLMSYQFVGTPEKIKEMYENSERRELLQKSINSEVILKSFFDRNIDRISHTWLDRSLDLDTSTATISTTRRLGLIGRQLRRTMKETPHNLSPIT